MAQIDAQMRRLEASTYYNVLTEYKVSKPRYLGYTNYKAIPPNRFDDSDILKVLETTYPINEYDTIYFIIPQPGIAPERAAVAYHSFWGTGTGRAYGIYTGNYVMDTITDAISEEVAEFATNPYNTGWHANKAGSGFVHQQHSGPEYEMVDVCAGKTARVNDVKVTGIWSNKQGRCVFG
jgi:hypothetical protein